MHHLGELAVSKAEPALPDSPDSFDATALWITAPERCELRREPVVRSDHGNVIVESLFGAISRGTERLIFEGRVPPGEYGRMKGPNQEGSFPFPVKYGYAVVGRVAAGPDHTLGSIVFALHPHQDRFVASLEDLVPVPDGIPPERAVLAANMETALNIVWDAGILPGDRVAVVGGGLVGSLAASLCARVPGTQAWLVDVDPARRPVAEALGLRFAEPNDAPSDLDVVVHSSGSAKGLELSIAIAGFEARIVEASWYGEGDTPVPLGGAFHSRRLSLVASQVGSVPPARRARWTNRRRMESALQLLADDRIEALISGESRFADLEAAYADILSAPGTLCHRIRYV